MKKVLYITAFPPNRKSGGQTYSLNLIEDLGRNYKVDLFYFDYLDSDVECISVGKVNKFYPSIRNSFFTPFFFPIFTKRFDKAVLSKIRRISDDYDVLIFDFSQVSIYSLHIDHPYKVIRCHDVLYQKYSRKNWIIGKWVKICEKIILKSANKVFVPSEKDSNLLLEKLDVKSTWTSEYLKEFNPSDVCMRHLPMMDRFVFFGLWSRPENLKGLEWFIINVFPYVKHHEFCIIGGGLPEEFKSKYSHISNIIYLGFVDDPCSEIYRSNALIAPIFEGAGVKVKVLDSFTTGTPVIGTNIAFEGIEQPEQLINEVNDVGSFISKINSFKPFTKEYKLELMLEFKKYYGKNHLPDYLFKSN